MADSVTENNLIDIIENDKYRQKLIIINTKNTKNGQYMYCGQYMDCVVKELKERCVEVKNFHLI